MFSLNNKYITQIAKTTNKYTHTQKSIFTIGLSMSTLGFYRGVQEYHHNQIKNKNIIAKPKDYMLCFMFGLINSSFYVNPSLMGLALHYEYTRVKSLLNDEFDELTYYTNPHFSVLT